MLPISLVSHPDLINVRNLDLAPLPMLARMMRYGTAIDLDYLSGLSEELGDTKSSLEREIRKHVPAHKFAEWKGKAEVNEADEGDDEEAGVEDSALLSFNINSPEQVAWFLFDTLGLGEGQNLKRTPDGKRISTGKKQLEVLKGEHEAVKLLLDYREVAKLKATYTDALPHKAILHPKGKCPYCSIPGDERHHKEAHYRIHTTFTSTRAATGRLASKNPNCLSGDTEILTSSGWRRLDYLYENQWEACMVAQWNYPDGSIEFVEPTSFVTVDSCESVTVSSQHIDLDMTTDHRCPLVHRRTGDLRVFKATDYRTDWKQINAGTWGGIDEPIITTAQLQLLVMIQADGSWCNNGRAVMLTFRKGRKINRCREILTSCGLRFHEYPRKNGDTNFYLHTDTSLDFIRTWMSVPDKIFNFSLLFQLTREDIDMLLDEFMFWDGCWERRNHYASKHKENADFVQTLFVLSGRRANVRRYDYRDYNTSWQVDVTCRDYSFTTNAAVSINSQKTGKAYYCVSVPSTFMLVRRNGKVCVTGNCQNIPKRSKIGKRIRAAFIPQPGMKWVSADFSQIELRILAHYSNDPYMRHIYDIGGDIHSMTAMNAFGVSQAEYAAYDEAQKKDFEDYKRLPAKSVGFGLVYGMTAKGLQAQLALTSIYWTEEECQDFIDKWLGVFVNVLPWMKQQEYRALTYGFVWDLWGRVRWCPGIHSAHKRIIAEALREAGNMPIQASSAGLTKYTMALMEQRDRTMYDIDEARYNPLLTIHDEVIYEAEEEIAEDLLALNLGLMSSAIELRVPVAADGKVKERW